MRVYYLLPFILLAPFIQTASAQTITVNSTTPCFLNYTAGWHVWQNCGADVDYIRFALIGWEWISGGFFSMVFVAILILFTWIKYQKIAYPMMIGVMFLPVSYFLFPSVFITFAFVMFGLGMAIFVWYAFIKQTKEY